MCDMLHQHWGDETMFIDAGEDERCASEYCSFTSFSPPDLVTCEELIGSYNLSPSSVHIKYNLIKNPHL